ncbi:MAG: DUF5658 family protein [Methanoregula sp.]|nr:DUF5658 family protein [Methanoregula sp.]
MAAQEYRWGTLQEYLDYRPVDDTTHRRITEFSLILAALFLLDILTTELILWLGGIELNPAMVGIVTSPLVHLTIKACTLILIILVSLVAETRVRGSSMAFYCILITLYLFVIVNNAFVLIPHIVG